MVIFHSWSMKQLKTFRFCLTRLFLLHRVFDLAQTHKSTMKQHKVPQWAHLLCMAWFKREVVNFKGATEALLMRNTDLSQVKNGRKKEIFFTLTPAANCDCRNIICQNWNNLICLKNSESETFSSSVQADGFLSLSSSDHMNLSWAFQQLLAGCASISQGCTDCCHVCFIQRWLLVLQLGDSFSMMFAQRLDLKMASWAGVHDEKCKKWMMVWKIEHLSGVQNCLFSTQWRSDGGRTCCGWELSHAMQQPHSAKYGVEKKTTGISASKCGFGCITICTLKHHCLVEQFVLYCVALVCEHQHRNSVLDKSIQASLQWKLTTKKTSSVPGRHNVRHEKHPVWTMHRVTPLGNHLCDDHKNCPASDLWLINQNRAP